MRVQGAWPEALEEFERAVDRYRQAHALDAAGLAESERGDVLRLRGEYDAADAAYQRAGEHGYDPQPGLALLWLARGAPDAAAGAVRRLLAEPADPVHRCRLLPGAVEVLLGVGAVDEARTAARELDVVAAQVGSPAVLATAAYAAAAVEVAAGDAAGALPYLRKARQLWARVGSPYDGARVRLLTGRALAVLGDAGSARAEAEAALASFRALGAVPAAREAEALLSPATLPAGLTAREVEVLRLVAAGPQQRRDRRRAGAQREDRRPAPVQHLHQARRRLPHRRRGVRVRARPGLTRLCSRWLEERGPWSLGPGKSPVQGRQRHVECLRECDVPGVVRRDR